MTRTERRQYRQGYIAGYRGHDRQPTWNFRQRSTAYCGYLDGKKMGDCLTPHGARNWLLKVTNHQ